MRLKAQSLRCVKFFVFGWSGLQLRTIVVIVKTTVIYSSFWPSKLFLGPFLTERLGQEGLKFLGICLRRTQGCHKEIPHLREIDNTVYRQSGVQNKSALIAEVQNSKYYVAVSFT